MHDEIDYHAIEQRVTRRIQRRYRFFFHTVLFIIGIPIIAGWNSPEVFLLWVALWASHLLWVNYQANLEAAIADEIERERLRRYHHKHDGGGWDVPANALALHADEAREGHPRWLGDDGEFVEVYDEGYEVDEREHWH